MANKAQKRGSAVLASSVVIAAAGAFLSYSAALYRGPVEDGVVLQAHFNSANGLHEGADVDLAGVSVGRVKSIRLDPVSQMANVSFTVDKRLSLPVDTAASIGAPSMTSDNALQLHPGHADRKMQPGGTLQDTQDQVSLEQQVSNYIFGGGGLGQ